MKFDFETDDGFGSRAVLGLITLETDETIEAEFKRMCDFPGVAVYHSRIPMVPEILPETLAKMESDLPSSARLFPQSAAFDVIGYGCTSGATVIGDAAVARAVQSVRPEAEVTNPIEAIIAGCRAIDAKRLGFITPYVPSVSQKMRDRLEAEGFQIGAFGSFEEGDDRIVARITSQSIRDAAIKLASSAKFDAFVIACTNLRVLSVILEIEAETGVAALSSNQAMAWRMLRLAGVTETEPGFGRLFRH